MVQKQQRGLNQSTVIEDEGHLERKELVLNDIADNKTRSASHYFENMYYGSLHY